jgi:hypothetical protein
VKSRVIINSYHKREGGRERIEKTWKKNKVEVEVKRRT